LFAGGVGGAALKTAAGGAWLAAGVRGGTRLWRVRVQAGATDGVGRAMAGAGDLGARTRVLTELSAAARPALACRVVDARR